VLGKIVLQLDLYRCRSRDSTQELTSRWDINDLFMNVIVMDEDVSIWNVFHEAGTDLTRTDDLRTINTSFRTRRSIRDGSETAAILLQPLKIRIVTCVPMSMKAATICSNIIYVTSIIYSPTLSFPLFYSSLCISLTLDLPIALLFTLLHGGLRFIIFSIVGGCAFAFLLCT
jgi:hypothetical protein